MTILYIGHYNEGSTSGMRGEHLRQILKPQNFKLANIDIPINKTGRIFRSIGWRYKIGPFITRINNYIVNVINKEWNYDLVWIDKGVFIKPEIIKKLRYESKLMVHFTPDPAFAYHQSSLFYKSIKYFDVCITTKSFELENYRKNNAKKVLYCTQGYDKNIHKAYCDFNQKDKTVSFIGHFEKERGDIIQYIIDQGIDVHVAGIKWGSFLKKNSKNLYLHYYGPGIFGTDYAKFISSSKFSLGLLSKWIPEKHTTRTFEIPACGTAIITERTTDTLNIFQEDEVLFYNTVSEIPDIIKNFLVHEEQLINIITKGKSKIINGGFDYLSIMKKLLSELNLIGN